MNASSSKKYFSHSAGHMHHVNTPPGCINAVVCISLRYRFLSPNRESTLIKDQNNNPKTTNLMIPF